MTVLCPHCGRILKSCKVTPSEDKKLVGRCINCSGIIPDLNTTLLYYCGYVVPDSSVILSGIISKDMERRRFFEGFTFLIHPVIRRECDNKGGRKELGRLAHFSSIGRINFREPQEDSDKEQSPDELIVNTARKYNAIVYTRDRGMYGAIISKGMFCLTK